MEKSELLCFEASCRTDGYYCTKDSCMRRYFVGLFGEAVDPVTLDMVWCSIAEVSQESKVYCAIEEVVALIEENQRRQDAKLASSLQKAERRRAAKRRNRERKSLAEPSLVQSAVVLNLTISEKAAYRAIRGVLESEWTKFGDDRIVAALKKHDCDVDGALDSLLLSSGENNVSVVSPPARGMIHSDRSRSSVPTDEVVLPALRSSNASVSVLGTMRPLLNHFIAHIRSRNPGIQVRYDQDFLLYIGHEQQFSLTENPSELRVDIDLHGMTKKPALDILQSSLLHYHELLAPGKLEQMLATRAVMLSTSNKAGVALSLNPARVKAFVVVYVVGQGLHSSGAVPVLRNAFTRELEQYWSVFDSFTDPANAGQIVVRVRRVR